jgi:hypothetical protein
MIRRGSLLGPLALYAGAAAVFTWPLVLHPTSVLAAPEGPGDPYLNLWILGWDLRAVVSDPLSILDGRIFDANIFHPARQTLAYSDHLILQALLVTPLYLASGDVVFCYNALLYGSLVASAFAMHVFVRAITGSHPAALFSGLAWGFFPYRFAHLIHLQLQSLYFLPLAFLFLHRLIAARRRRDAAALGGVAALQAISSAYYGVIGGIGIAVCAIALAAGAGCWRKPALLRRLALSVAIGAVLVAPVVWVYWQVQQREGFGRNLVEAGRHSATLADYAAAPPVNLLYGRTRLLTTAAGHENELFVGFTLLGLAIAGLVIAPRRGARPAALAMTAVVVVGFVLSLGPDGIRPVYAAFHRFVFGFQAVRAPARFAVLVQFGLTTLAAFAVREIVARSRQAGGPGRLVAPALVGLASVEFLNAPVGYVPAPERSSALGRWLAAQPPGPVVHMPLEGDRMNTPYMVSSLEHGRPIVNGYSGNRPGFYAILRDETAGFPSSGAFFALHGLGVRYITSTDPIDTTGWPVVERARFAAEPRNHLPRLVAYELRWSRESDAKHAPPPPAAPSRVPFVMGERAVYAVTWQGAMSAVPAGTASISVEPISPDEAPAGVPSRDGTAFRFVARAETAAWMTRFFEARDVFATVATPDLLPLVHQRQLREGRRSVDLTVTYDHARGVVTRGSEIAVGMPAGTRDPLTVLFYLRSVELKPGVVVRLPVNDAGRNLVIEAASRGVERITHGGSEIDALRVDPRIAYAASRRAPPRITAWLSTDDRRIPLVVDVAAGFGSIRAELVEYRRR